MCCSLYGYAVEDNLLFFSKASSVSCIDVKTESVWPIISCTKTVGAVDFDFNDSTQELSVIVEEDSDKTKKSETRMVLLSIDRSEDILCGKERAAFPVDHATGIVTCQEDFFALTVSRMIMNEEREYNTCVFRREPFSNIFSESRISKAVYHSDTKSLVYQRNEAWNSNVLSLYRYNYSSSTSVGLQKKKIQEGQRLLSMYINDGAIHCAYGKYNEVFSVDALRDAGWSNVLSETSGRFIGEVADYIYYIVENVITRKSIRSRSVENIGDVRHIPWTGASHPSIHIDDIAMSADGNYIAVMSDSLVGDGVHVGAHGDGVNAVTSLCISIYDVRASRWICTTIYNDMLYYIPKVCFGRANILN